MNNLEVSDFVLKETSPWLVFRSFKNKQWLTNAVRLSLTFAPKCVLPAVLGLVSISAWLAAAFIMTSRMTQMNEVSEVLIILGSAMAGLLVSGISCCWSFALWAMRLTAVSAATLSLPENVWSRDIESSVLKAHMNDAISKVKERRGFLTKYYLLVGLYMLAPTVCFSICSAVLVSTHLMPTLTLPQWFEISAMVGIAGSSAFIFALSMISLVVSSSCQPLVQKSVYKTIGLSITCFLPCLVLSLLTLVLLTVTTEPLTPFMMTQPAVLNAQTFIMIVVNFVWQSVVSVFVLPFVIIPFSELLRGRFE